MRHFAVILSCSIVLAGCHSKIDSTELVGTFTANPATYKDLIDIRKDGTYVHIYHLNPQGQEITSTNKWSCETNDGEMRLTFQKYVWGTDFVQPNLSTAERAKPGFWDVEVEKSFGTVRLRIHPDVREYYVKVK